MLLIQVPCSTRNICRLVIQAQESPFKQSEIKWVILVNTVGKTIPLRWRFSSKEASCRIIKEVKEMEQNQSVAEENLHHLISHCCRKLCAVMFIQPLFPQRLLNKADSYCSRRVVVQNLAKPLMLLSTKNFLHRFRSFIPCNIKDYNNLS